MKTTYRSLIKIFSRLGVLLIFSVAVNAQETGQLIRTQYDESKDFTQITFNPVVLASRKLEELRLGAITGYSGKVKTRPKDIGLVFLSLSTTDENRYADTRKLIVVADERRFDWGQTQRSKQVQHGLFVEAMTSTVPLDDFLFVANAKKVKLRVGLTEVELTPSHIKLFQVFVSYILE